MSKFEICKLTGAANTKTWAQVHVFEPQAKQKKNQFGQLFAVFSLESRQADSDSLLEVTAFGREILTRFHELYFAGDKLSSCQKRLEKALEVIKTEFADQVIVSAAAAAVLEADKQAVLYVSRVGKAQAYLWRENQLVKLLSSAEAEESESVSGWLQAEDSFILGTDKAFELIPHGSLQAALQLKPLNQAMQILAPIVQGHKDNALAALVMGKLLPLKTVKKEGLIIEDTKKQSLETQKEKKASGIFVATGLLTPVKQLISKIGGRVSSFSINRKQPSLDFGLRKPGTIRVRQSNLPISRSRKMAMSVAFLFLLLLGISIGIGFYKKRTKKIDQQIEQVLETVTYNLEQAQQLQDLNPGRAKSLLLEAQTAIENYQSEHLENQNPDLQAYEEKIKEELVKVSREHKINEATVFFDLSLIKEDFKAKGWGVTAEETVILGKEAVATLNLDKKQTKVIAGGEKITPAQFISSVSPWAILATETELLVADKSKERVIDTQKLDEVTVASLVGYAGNAYVLDTEHHQVWRFAGLNDGLAKKKSYFKGEPDLTGAVSLAIDGSVWILFTDGGIVKYTQGQQDAFVISGLDKPFHEPISLFTNEDQENLYILDRRNTRVVVIAKTGEYQAQYVWPGIAGVVDLLASENLGKIFLLTDSKIYSIDIKE